MKAMLALLLSSLAFGTIVSTAQTGGANPAASALPPPVSEARVRQLQDLRFGMFICWSFSTFSGKEWTPGVTDVAFFQATSCDTDQWARTAKEAGMGYILFLTKHHDGFCLWDTRTTDRKVTKAPLGRDVLAELRKSCYKYGIKLALYFSEGEWRQPGGLDDPATPDPKKRNQGGSNAELKKTQLRELLTQYGPIEYIWFDHAVGDGGLSHAETIAFCKALQPECFIGFNHGEQEGADIRLGEMGRPGPLDDHQAAGPHMRDAPATTYRLAEFTYPILPKHQGGAMWFYSLPKHDGLCHPADKIYADYLGAVKYGNLFSLDVGPDYAGQLREIDVRTLQQVGEMIRNKAPLPATTNTSGLTGTVRASSTWGPGFEADRAIDGNDATRWGAERGARSGWLEIDLGREIRIGRVVVKELRYPRTEEFAVEYKKGDAWVPLHRGTTIAGDRVYDFAPVEARYVRVNITQANEVPTIEEFQVLAPGAVVPTSASPRTPPPAAPAPLPPPEPAREARLRWFHEAKYGLFINWGLYSIPAGEWKGKPIAGIGEWIMNRARIPVKEYEQLAPRFNPAKFDAEAWAQLAVDAGMKYLVFDCKHHDGFALYRSQVSPYNCYNATPWKRDPFKELQAACAKRGLKLCFYYSQAQDWHDPNGAGNDWDFGPDNQKDFDRYLREKSLPQVRELLTGYGPIGLIWFDTPRSMTPERSRLFVDLVRSLQPDTLINSRLGPGGLHDYQSRGDNEIPHIVTPGAWETAATINDTWGFKKDDHNWKTPADICFKLVDIVSKGGNYLLNVGPDADGFIPQASQDILRKVGAWLKINGAAIYGAGRTPFGDELGTVLRGPLDKRGQPPFAEKKEWRCTTKPGRLYVHLFKWPAAPFELSGVTTRVTKAFLLADREHTALRFTQVQGRVTIDLPANAPDAIASVVCIEHLP